MAHSATFSLPLQVLRKKPVGVRPPRFPPLSARAYTRPDVPREFYPRRSADSTHFPHLPDMRHLRGEGKKKSVQQTAARRSAVDFLHGFVFWTERVGRRENFAARRRDGDRQQ